jgi:hypothetical protein
VIGVPGYRSRGSSSIRDATRFSGVERGPFSLVSTTEGLLGRSSGGSDLEIR